MRERGEGQGGAGCLPAPLYYGWVIVWTLALTETVSYGVLYYSYGVFLAPMEQDLGWSRAQTSGAFSVALLVSGLAAPFVGRVVDRQGGRLVMTLGSLVGALLVLAWSRVTTLPALYATWAALGLVMACVFYDPAFTVVAQWFSKKRPQALLAITLVAGLASSIFIPLGTALLSELGWRSALVGLAGLLAALTVLPHGLLLRRRPQDLGLFPDGAREEAPLASLTADLPVREVIRGPSFRRLAVAFSLAQFTAVALAAHIVPLLRERGYPVAFVALAAGAIGAAALPGRALFAPLMSRLSLARVTTAVFAARVLALMALLLLPGLLGVWVFVGLFGASNGMTTLVRASLIAELYGRANYGAISGVLALVVALAQSAAPFAAGGLHTWTGSYGLVVWGLLMLAGLGTWTTFRLGARPGAAA